jgi:uncharacterized membrane protein
LKFSKRHILKTITWRTIGSLDTLLLSWFISGNLSIGIQIGVVEVVTKMILYYVHERLWFKADIENTNKRHIIKTFSWRAIGTIDTFILAWIITGNPLTGLKIGVSEVFTKMLLYYGHEKLWYRINFGLDKRNRFKRSELNLRKQQQNQDL